MHLRLASALPFLSFTAAWTTYVVPHSSGNDDTPALAAAFSKDQSLATDATILFQKGVTYNMLTPITFPIFQNVIVSVQGNLTYAADVKGTQGEGPKPLDTSFHHSCPIFTYTSNRQVLGKSCRPSLKSTHVERPSPTELPGALVRSLPFDSSGSLSPHVLGLLSVGVPTSHWKDPKIQIGVG